MDSAREDALRQTVADLALYQAAQRAGTEGRIVPCQAQPLQGGGGNIQGQAAVGQTLAHALNLQVHNLSQMLGRERLEHDDVVQTVQELGTERLVNHLHRLLGALLKRHLLIDQVLRTQVRGQNQNHVAEVHGTALTVSQTTVIKHLQQNIEDLGVSLLNLVQQHHGVGATAHGLGQLTALFVTHISGRRTHQAGNAVLLAVLTHVDTHQGVLVIKLELRESLRELGLAHTGRSQEQEGTNRAVRVGNSGAGAANRIRHSNHGGFLTDQAFTDTFLHLQQLLRFALKHAPGGNTRPGRDNLGNVVSRDLFRDHSLAMSLSFGALSFFQFLLLGGNFAVEQAGCIR